MIDQYDYDDYCDKDPIEHISDDDFGDFYVEQEDLRSRAANVQIELE